MTNGMKVFPGISLTIIGLCFAPWAWASPDKSDPKAAPTAQKEVPITPAPMNTESSQGAENVKAPVESQSADTGSTTQRKPVANPATVTPSAVPLSTPSKWTVLKDGSVAVSTLFNFAAGWTDQDLADIEARPLLSLHRARIWLRGAITQRVKYVTHFAFDRIGADQFALLQGKPSASATSPIVQDLFLRYDALPKGAFRITSGYFRPSVGRENNSAVIALPNHDIALTGVLARRGSVGTGPGRAAGVNMGGRVGQGFVSVLYQGGIFGPTTSGQANQTEYTQSIGGAGSPLVAGGLALTLGERQNFVAADYLFLPNAWDKGFSFTIGGTGSHQGQTEDFDSSSIVTGYVALNYQNFFVDGEFVKAQRSDTSDMTFSNTAWHIRSGLNFFLSNSVLAPFVTISELDGQNTEGKTKLFSGKSLSTDLGVNWHLNKNSLQLGFHALRVSDQTPESDLRKQPVREGTSYLLNFQIQH